MRRILMLASAAVIVAGATTTAIVASSVTGSKVSETEQECVRSCSEKKSDCSGYAEKYRAKGSCSEKSKSESADLK